MSLIGPKRRFTALQRYVRSWNTSRHGADIVSVPRNLVTPRLTAERTAQQLRQLGDVGGDPTAPRRASSGEPPIAGRAIALLQGDQFICRGLLVDFPMDRPFYRSLACA